MATEIGLFSVKSVGNLNNMATKRMFDRAIIDTDKFMDMPLSAKAIYFLLGMEADDEGFVSYKKVMRVHGGNDDDVKILIAKGLIILFESGVVVVTDWNKNNWLDSRRIKPTEYEKEKKQLEIRNGVYMLSNGLASIVESSIEENRIEQIAPPTESPFIWNEYLEGMDNNKRLDLQLIGYFFRRRNLSFSSKNEAEVAIRRHLRAAKDVSVFGKAKVFKAMDECDYLEKQKGIRWTLDTCLKFLTK